MSPGRGLVTLAILLLASHPASLGAGGPAADLREWRFRRPINISGTPAEFGEITVDGALYETAAPAFSDIRITSDDGHLVPHVVREWPASTSERTVSARVVNRSVIPGRLTRLEVHTGTTQPHNRLQLEIAGGQFSRRVTVEGSDDRQRWLGLASLILSRTADQGAAPVTIPYPDSTYRYVRLSLLDQGEPPLQVTAAALVFTQITPAREDTWYAGAAGARTDAAAKMTTVTVDVGHRNIPIARAWLTVTAPAAFARPVAVEISDDRQVWQRLGRPRIVRTREESAAMPVDVAFQEGVGRYLRLTIENGDDVPLEIGRIEVAGIRQTILFPLGAGPAYWLYVGAPDAPAAEYDLPQVLSLRRVPPQPAAARLGPSEPNPAYVPPVVRRPWTEERPWLLWGALVVSTAVILGLIAGTLRAMRAAS